MNGTNSTQFSTWLRLMGLSFVLTLSTFNLATSQSCACKGTLNVSVDEECSATISAEQVLANGSTCGGTSSAVVTLMRTPTTGVIATGTGSAFLDDARLFVGKTIYAKVATADGQNSCWSTILIEDKMKPRWENDTPDTVVISQCLPVPAFLPSALDNCKLADVFQVGEDIVVNNCDNVAGFAGPDTLKLIRRTFRAVDGYGNMSDTDCHVVIYIRAFASNDITGISNRVLKCDEPYARIPAGQPFAGHPSPVNIGTAVGTGVPSRMPWMASTRGAGKVDINPANGNIRMNGGTDTGTSAGMGAQICVTATGTGNIGFSWSALMQGSTPPTGNFNGDHAQWSLNNSPWTNLTTSGPGDVMQSGTESVGVVADDMFCIRVRTNNNLRWTELMISNITGPIPATVALNPDAPHCNIVTSYTDMQLPMHKCTQKILRTWKIIDWSCNNRILELVQMIEIIDDKAPVISGLQNDEVSTHGHACEAMYRIQKPTLSDNCSPMDKLKYSVQVIDSEGNYLAQMSDLTVTGGDNFIRLPVGCNTLVYTAFDECHNQSRDSILLFVEDNTPPVAVCRQNTVVGLTTGGKAWVPATSFNEGSYDECDLAKVLVRRMDNSNCLPCKVPTIEGFTYLGEYQRPGEPTPHHYYASKHKANPKVAMKTAAAVGGYLTSINDSAEGTWVHARVKDWRLGLDYLIGLRDEKNKNEFVWIGGQNATYRNWATGEPINRSSIGTQSIWVTVRDAVGGMDGRWFTQTHDNCDQDEWIYVVEIDNVCEAYGDFVEFCCADISSSPEVVIMRAIDKSGNWNECMVNASVQDKQPIVISCPPHQTVTCLEYFDLSVDGLKSRFGEATLVGNCTNGVIQESFTHDLNSCRIGTITRTFTAVRGTETRTCTQIINVIGDSNFSMTANRWPLDVEIEGCTDPESPALSPDILGRPDLIADNTCSLVGADWKDQIFYFNNTSGEACFKILRHWTVIDWCQYYESNGGREYRTWTHTQVIKVNDFVKPIILSDCGPKEVCTYDATCQAGYIELIASANDNCTQNLRFSYKIDLFNDKIFETLSNGSVDPRYSKSGISTGVGNSFVNTVDASGTYPVGTHRIEWSFEDRCGNLTKCEQLFTIANCKAPTPYCINGLATSLMPVDTNGDGTADSGMVEIWAKDWDAGSEHPCGYEILHSFEPITLDANGRPVLSMVRQFTCADRPRVDLDIYVGVITPMGNLIQDFCSTFITIQDNFGVCPPLPAGRFVVEGTVETEEALPIANTFVELSGTEMDAMTNQDGQFMFDDLIERANYFVKASKNNDIMNGVSTLDLVMIQRHILGIAEITSPYKQIAADINKDNRLTAADLTELRKVILGVAQEFTNNESWRFVDKNYVFINANQAYAEAIPEMCEIETLDADKKVDFVAIKVGDVNGNVTSNGKSAIIESRNRSILALSTENVQFESGQTLEVPFSVNEAAHIGGFQFTFNFDAEMYNLLSVDGTIPGMTDNNFGFNRLAEGILTVSYGNENGLYLSEGQNLFRVTLQAKTAGALNNSVWVNSLVTKSEAYTSELHVMNLQFNVNQRTNTDIVLYQNTPNPFRGTTSIGFDLPKESIAKVTIYDVTGRAVKVIDGTFSKGYNVVEVERGEMGSAGVFYYTLEVADFKATKKMVVID